MEKIKRNKLYIFAFFLVLIVCLVYKFIFKGDLSGLDSLAKREESVTDSSDLLNDYSSIQEGGSTTTLESSSTEQQYISIYICGCVNNPGVYEIASGNIINDVVLMAGGLTDEAASNYINLAYILVSNMTIYVPSNEEIGEMNQESTINNPDIYRIDNSSTLWGTSGPNTYQESGDGSNQDVDSLVNINSASKDELMSLPGIGEVYAQAIIDYRQETPFTCIEDIMNVSGIGESRYSNIEHLICV